MPITEILHSQKAFMLRGGIYEQPLLDMQKKGILDTDYVYREYPKMIRISHGFREAQKSTEDCKGRILTWTETVEDVEEIIVHSEAEEERVLSGGKTSAQLEEERQGLLRKARTMGLPADPAWSTVRLRRELGDVMDAPAPANNMEKLEAELAALKRMAAMQAEIEALKAQLAKPADEAEEIRQALRDLGVEVDGRWSLRRLREELEKATEA